MKDFYKMAVRNISKLGDTDIFPFPIENVLFYDKSKEVEDVLIDLDKNYDKLIKTSPIESIKTCIPVGYTGFRWATMIDPVWNAFFLGEVLKISAQIEQKRIPVEEKSIFSYRMKYDEESGTLFDREVNWRAFYKNAGEISEEYKYIVTFDISDFYNRINHERLRNVLHNDIKADGIAVDRIMGIVAGISGGNDGYGLPIGGNASRILAEALLVRTDNFMKEKGIKFCRFVDDFIVFANSLGEAYNLLNSCADYFLRYLGLSLQKNKTTIMTLSEFRRHIKTVFDEITEDKDSARTSVMRLNMNVDPYSATADEALKDLKGQIASSGIISLLKSECRKTKINQLFGKQLVRAVQFIDEENISEAYNVLSLNFDKLYPVFPLIMRSAHKNLLKCNSVTINAFISRIAELFDTNSYIIQTDNNASYAIRVLSLVRDKQTEQIIRNLYARQVVPGNNSSELIKMNAVYAMTNLGNTEWLTERLPDFPHLSSWERRAVVASASFLGENGKAWRNTFMDYCSPLENLVGDWVSEKHSVQPNWKLPL